MTCFHPNYIVSKKLPYREYLEFKYRYKNGVGVDKFKPMKDKPFMYRFLTSKEVDDKTSDYWKFVEDKEYNLVPVPCGCCIGCRLDYSRQWANRCYLESLLYQDNYFLTLTYDDNHIRFGEVGNATLVEEDFTKFMKDLRRYFEYHFHFTGIRFYGCGEYGDSSLRPHYHILLFNCPIPDLTLDFPAVVDGENILTQHNANGDLYYYSDIIHSIWSKGNILIGKLSWQSCAYVARYVMKKQKGKDKDVYDSLGIVSEFVKMSRMPGIGIPYYELHKSEIYANDSVLVVHDDPVYVQPPRAFDKRYQKDAEKFFNEVKIKRQANQDDIINTFDNTYQAHFKKSLENKENLKKMSISSLHRSL